MEKKIDIFLGLIYFQKRNVKIFLFYCAFFDPEKCTFYGAF